MINIRKSEQQSIPPLDELILLFFGQPGTGKTKLCDEIPNCLFVATEPGHEFTKSAVFTCANWVDFMNLIKHLKETSAKGCQEYTTFVIDIVDNLAAFCRDFVCAQKKLAYPPTNDFGKTWAEIAHMWKNGISALAAHGNIIFITHCTTREVEIEDESGMKIEVEQFIPTFSGSKSAQFLDGIVNAQGYLTCDKSGLHIITFKKTATVAAKDRTNVLSRYNAISIDWKNGKTGWQNLNEAYMIACQKLNLKIESRRKPK
jgi:DNA polymerase III delta prime subunit